LRIFTVDFVGLKIASGGGPRLYQPSNKARAAEPEGGYEAAAIDLVGGVAAAWPFATHGQ
jgi:hypothetical protein